MVGRRPKSREPTSPPSRKKLSAKKQKAHPCYLCEREFTPQYVGFRAHMDKRHTRRGTTFYCCHLCGWDFVEWFQCALHLRSRHSAESHLLEEVVTRRRKNAALTCLAGKSMIRMRPGWGSRRLGYNTSCNYTGSKGRCMCFLPVVYMFLFSFVKWVNS